MAWHLAKGPSHYLNKCWNIVNWTLWNKLQWNLNQNEYIFFQANAFRNVVWKMAAILSQLQSVNWLKADWWHMVSWKTGSGNGFLPALHQAITSTGTWTNADILSIEPSGTNLNETTMKIQKFFIYDNVFANVSCKMVAILYRPLLKVSLEMG